MRKSSQTVNTGLDQLKEILNEAKILGINMPPELQKPGTDPQLVLTYLRTFSQDAGKATTLLQKVNDFAEREVVNRQREVTETQGAQSATQGAQSATQGAQSATTAKIKKFNLKQAQSPFDMTTQDTTPITDETSEKRTFNSIVDLVSFLDGTDMNNARAELFKVIDESKQQQVADILGQYYEKDWTRVDDAETKKINSKGMKFIWDAIVSTAKSETAQLGNVEGAQFKETEITSFVSDVNNSLKKLAYESVKNENKPFNLKKEAQAKTTENIIMYGPSEKRYDAFLRQPISDWHIVERNKGFGLVVDDAWNIDWEAIWRGNVMDKYSRPYRDTKTGEWIGGYIQKRFEVDKWIPAQNNLQLLPGELRKPLIPERGIIEGRLEAMRQKEGKKKGFEPDSSGKPYYWNGEPEYAQTKIATFNLKKSAQIWPFKKKENSIPSSPTKTVQQEDPGWKFNSLQVYPNDRSHFRVYELPIEGIDKNVNKAQFSVIEAGKDPNDGTIFEALIHGGYSDALSAATRFARSQNEKVKLKDLGPYASSKVETKTSDLKKKVA
jgi:hypothetical protein